MATPVITHDEELRIVMVGKSGVGKRPAANTIVGYEAFKFNVPACAPVISCQKVRGVVDGRNISVVETPGCVFDTNLSVDEVMKVITQCFSLAAPGPHVFLIVIRLGRVPVTEEELNSVKIIQMAFGEMSNKYTMVLFTVGEGLKGKPVEDFLKENPKLQELIRKCDGRYHVFNDKPKDASEVTELLVKIDSMVQTNGKSHYTTQVFQEAESAIIKEVEEVCIMMVGRSGVGKRPAANAFLGCEAFTFTNVPASPAVSCQKVRGVVDGRNISVVDTPGCMFDTDISEDEVMKAITQCYSLAAPGPHVFLIVIRLGRVPVTEEELNSVKMIQMAFGEMSNKYTMVLFTVGDGLKGKPVEDFLKESPKLQEFIRKCDGRYHVFNDKPKDASQFTELLVKIDLMVKTNGGSYYTNELFKEAEDAIKKEQDKIVE